MKHALLLAAVAALALGSATASDCASYSTTTPILTLHWVGGNGLYVTGDLPCFVADAPMCRVYVYEEANGIAGLQRADELADDTCHGMIASDTIIF